MAGDDEPPESPHILRFRDSELNATHSRYDNIVAGGSDEQRRRQWIIYASVALVVAAFVLVVLASILVNKEVRNKPFNLFLIFLMIPDLVFSSLCGLTCALNAANGDYISERWCNFQVFYCVWGIGANAWLNGAVARHIHKMLLCNQRGQRYFPPTRKRVVIESLAIYAGMAFLACWTFIDIFPHDARLSAGLACLPHEYDTASTFFQWLVFIPLFALIPLGYAMYVAVDVYRKKLLPPKGKKRDIAIYFGRLVVVFLIMWVPSIFLMFVAGGNLPAWVSFLGGVWSHLQGAVSAIVSVMKRDISKAFLRFVTCGYRETWSSGDSHPSSGSSALPFSLPFSSPSSSGCGGEHDTTEAGNGASIESSELDARIKDGATEAGNGAAPDNSELESECY